MLSFTIHSIPNAVLAMAPIQRLCTLVHRAEDDSVVAKQLS